MFSLETLIITVSAGAVAALVVGFVTGYCCGRRCNKDDNTLAGHLGYPDTEYEYFEQRGGLARPTLLSQVPPGVPLGGPGAPLLPQETAKVDSRHEEVSDILYLISRKILFFEKLVYLFIYYIFTLGYLCRARACYRPSRL